MNLPVEGLYEGGISKRGNAVMHLCDPHRPSCDERHQLSHLTVWRLSRATQREQPLRDLNVGEWGRLRFRIFVLVGFQTSGPRVSGNQYHQAHDYVSDHKVTERRQVLLPEVCGCKTVRKPVGTS